MEYINNLKISLQHELFFKILLKFIKEWFRIYKCNFFLRFLQLLGVVPSDANILQRLGVMYQNEGDKSQAYQYHYDVSTIKSEANASELLI